MKINKHSIALMIAIIFSLNIALHLSTTVTADAAVQVPANIDLNINTEISQQQAVLNEFFSLRRNGDDVVFENPQAIAAEYIPGGSQCTAVSVIGTVVYINYILNDVRYNVAYYSDGTVEKVARAVDGNDIYSTNSVKNSIEYMNVEENSKTISISDTEATQRMNQMIEEQWPEGSCYPIENTLTRASGKDVYALRYADVSSTAPYKAKIVNSGTVTIDAFRGTNYSTSQAYRVYETMSYHTEVTKKTQPFAIGVTLTKIASIFIVPENAVKIWLTLANVAFSSANILQEACQVVDENAYTFLGGKECGIYDMTQNMAYVETYSTWDEGKITMTWDYNSSTGYNDPHWGHSVRCKSLDTINSTVRDEGKNVYNNNISMYGVWRWGIGNGFGY